ncbi:MAG: NPXTG-anchored protein [Ruminiclostridium sp.]|nr:NPXTG-anchored protein [Ruminiclostridium sp.]
MDDSAVDDPTEDNVAGYYLAEDSNPNTGVAVGGMFMAMLACGGLAVITSRKRKNK